MIDTCRDHLPSSQSRSKCAESCLEVFTFIEVMSYDARADLNYITGTLNIWVTISWVVQWLLALGFSRFARWKASGGDEAWAAWALLPVYEWAIVSKKVGLALTVVAIGVSGWWLKPLFSFGMGLYEFTYLTVLYVLCATSAGTATFYRAIGFTVTALVVITCSSYLCATYIPLYVGGLKGAFWVATLTAILGTIGALIACTKPEWHPRQFRLAASLFTLWVATLFLGHLATFNWVKNAFGFTPLILIGMIEMPLKYYIMLLDSRVTPAPRTSATCANSLPCA